MQFTKEQMICNATNCDKEDTGFIDCTRGPLYDPRFYCEEHMPAVKEHEAKLSREAALSYQYSVVAEYEYKLEQAKIKLAGMESRSD
jgi:hypothetical protein